MRRQASKVWLSAEQQDELERFARSRTLAARCVERARILLGCAAGRENQQIGEELGVCRQTVGRWRERFVAQGMDGLEDRPRRCFTLRWSCSIRLFKYFLLRTFTRFGN